MSTTKSILKKKGKSGNKTRKSVMINPNFNEVANDNPEPITPRSKNERWTNSIDSKLVREELTNKSNRFKNARKAVPNIAARTARQKYNIPSPSPTKNDEDVIRVQRTSRQTSIPTNRGPITRFVSGFMNLFKRGGRKTRKNKGKM